MRNLEDIHNNVVGGEASGEWLSQELASTEKLLAETKKKQQQQQQQQQHLNTSSNTTEQQQQQQEEEKPLLVQLQKLRQTTDSLSLAQDVADWMDSYPPPPPQENDNDNYLFAQAALCESLAKLLLRQGSSTILDLYPSLYQETYLSLFSYVHASLTSLLQNELFAARYPKPEGCHKLLNDCAIFPLVCRWLIQLESIHHQVMIEMMVEGGRSMQQQQQPPSIVLMELLHPIVERVRFHFVERSEERITTTRIDRLPEWLLTYLRDHVLMIGGGDGGGGGSGPYDLLHKGIVPTLPEDTLSIPFLYEMTRLIQWVLTERNFFRDPKISGPRSNPLLLYNAVEQFLQFDKQLQEFMPSSSSSSSSSSSNNWQLMGLMDLLVIPDDELYQWWITRERESVFSTLFEDDSMINVPKPLANHVSPRAEMFCALIRSVQAKASALTVPGPYLKDVAVPLCSQFVDALQETSVDLRNLLCQKHPLGLPLESEMMANINEWMEIINGTHLASKVILKERAWQDGMSNPTRQSDHDLAPFGRSLERLRDVMVEEFASSFVETILMDRAKFASYLMMASHLLASEEWDGDETDLSAELRDSKVVLYQLHQVCNSILLAAAPPQDQENREDLQIAHFAPKAIQTHVMNRVADKFLEVAIDIHNMTPDLWQVGGKVFARDVSVMVGSSELPLVRRLLDTTKLLSADSNTIQALFSAIGGLVGAQTYLDIHDLSADDTLYDEAMSMIKAKGYSRIELQDVVSILNRRRD